MIRWMSLAAILGLLLWLNPWLRVAPQGRIILLCFVAGYGANAIARDLDDLFRQ